MRTKDYEKNGLAGFAEVLRKRPLKLFIATVVGGLGMWIVAGLWHNLLLPIINDNATAHHEGLGIGLIAYFILSFLLAYFYLQIYKKGSTFFEGVKIGPRKAREFLNTLNIQKDIIIHIENIITNISFKGGKHTQKFKSPELDVIQDADRLDALGAIGIARTFNYGGHKNREIYNPEIKPNLNMTKWKRQVEFTYPRKIIFT